MNSSFRKDIIQKPIYWVCIGFITVLSYLFDLTNRSVGIDDLARPIYSWAGKSMLQATRWGMNVWESLFTSSVYTPFIDKYLAILFLILTAVLLSRIFYRYFSDNRYKLVLCILISCLYISFPLINEIWNYNGANYITEGNAFLAAICILLLYKEDKLFNNKTILCSFLLTMIVSSYEASAFMYISMALAVVLMDYILTERHKWVTDGLRYAIPLLFAVVLRYVIGFALIKLFRTSYEPNGMTAILWNSGNGLLSQFKILLETTFDHYFLRGLIYQPIGIFVIALTASFVTAFVVSIKQRDFVILLIYLILTISLFILSILQSTSMPYRTAQTIHFFIAFALPMTAFALTFTNKHSFTVFAIACIGIICYRQGFFMNQTLALNNQRADNEASIAQNIGFRLKTEFAEKPVYFIGLLDLGSTIEQQVKPDETSIGGYIYRKLAYYLGWNYDNIRLYESNINSIMSWNSLYSQMMAPYFAYYGYDITMMENIDKDLYLQIVLYVLNEEMKPLEIRDMGSYILVYLGVKSW